jgi:hypothetical protein
LRRQQSAFWTGERLYSSGGKAEPEVVEDGEGFDRSYEEALLDLELRHFMRGEFVNIEPPEGSFELLQSRIQSQESNVACQTAEEPERIWMRGQPAATTRTVLALPLPSVGRFTSGLVAGVVLLLVLGSNASQLLRDGFDDLAPAHSTPAAATAEPLHQAAKEEPPEQLTPAWAYARRSNPTYTYDPAELGKQPLNRSEAKEEWEQRVERTRIGNEF